MFEHVVEFAPPAEPGPAPDGLGLAPKHASTLEDLRKRVAEGRFPLLMDFHPAFGEDLSACANLDDGVYALGNDGAGNYFVLYPDGTVDLWSHDEGGFMADYGFTSLEDLMSCLVLATAVKKQTLPWDEVSERFESRAADSEGWEYFQEEVEEYLEDL